MLQHCSHQEQEAKACLELQGKAAAFNTRKSSMTLTARKKTLFSGPVGHSVTLKGTEGKHYLARTAK